MNNIEIVEKWFEYLEKLDAEKICSLYNSDYMKFEWPFAPTNFPKVLEGNSQQMLTSVGGMFLGFKSLKAASKNIMKLEDPNTVLVIWNGDAEIVTGATYKNSYINLFKVKDGKIYEIVEYYNPLVILETFMGQKF